MKKVDYEAELEYQRGLMRATVLRSVPQELSLALVEFCEPVGAGQLVGRRRQQQMVVLRRLVKEIGNDEEQLERFQLAHLINIAAWIRDKRDGSVLDEVRKLCLKHFPILSDCLVAPLQQLQAIVEKYRPLNYP